MYSTLILNITGQTATITLNRPDKRNAMSAAMIAELQTALDEIEKSHVRVGIVTGAELPRYAISLWPFPKPSSGTPK